MIPYPTFLRSIDDVRVLLAIYCSLHLRYVKSWNASQYLAVRTSLLFHCASCLVFFVLFCLRRARPRRGGFRRRIVSSIRLLSLYYSISHWLVVDQLAVWLSTWLDQVIYTTVDPTTIPPSPLVRLFYLWCVPVLLLLDLLYWVSQLRPDASLRPPLFHHSSSPLVGERPNWERKKLT